MMRSNLQQKLIGKQRRHAIIIICDSLHSFIMQAQLWFIHFLFEGFQQMQGSTEDCVERISPYKGRGRIKQY
jgi:hypothetical protein